MEVGTTGHEHCRDQSGVLKAILKAECTQTTCCTSRPRLHQRWTNVGGPVSFGTIVEYIALLPGSFNRSGSRWSTLPLNYASVKEGATVKARTTTEAMKPIALSRIRIGVRDGKCIEHEALKIYEPPYIRVYSTSQPLISGYHNWTELIAIF